MAALFLWGISYKKILLSHLLIIAKTVSITIYVKQKKKEEREDDKEQALIAGNNHYSLLISNCSFLIYHGQNRVNLSKPLTL